MLYCKHNKYIIKTTFSPLPPKIPLYEWMKSDFSHKSTRVLVHHFINQYQYTENDTNNRI